MHLQRCVAPIRPAHRPTRSCGTVEAQWLSKSCARRDSNLSNTGDNARCLPRADDRLQLVTAITNFWKHGRCAVFIDDHGWCIDDSDIHLAMICVASSG